MEDYTQAAEEAGPSSPIRAPPVPLGYLRVLPQGELEERVYTIAEGETTIGRGTGCEVCIDAKSLSRKHTIILVEDGYHFIQDLGSRNKTYRKSLLLRPHTFYELTHGCELTLADVQCQYYISTPPKCYYPPDPEQTQTYDFEDDDGGAALNSEGTARSSSVTVEDAPDTKESANSKQTAPMSGDLEGVEPDVRAKPEDGREGASTSTAESTKANASVAEKSKSEVPEQTVLYTAVDSEGSTVGEEEEEGGVEGGMDGGEPTQAYLFDEGGEEDKPMEYEATVAYNVGDLNQSDDSAASSPLLAGGGCEATQFYPAMEDPESPPPVSPPKPKEKKKRVCFDSAVKNGSEDNIDGAPSSSSKPGPSSGSGSKKVRFEQTMLHTDPDEATQPYEDTTLGSDTEDSVMDVEQTVAYNVEGSGEEDSVPNETQTPRNMDVDQTVAYNVEGSGEEDGAPNETQTPRNMDVEQTVAYNMEENREDSIVAESRAAGRDNVEPTVPYLLEESEEDDTEEHTSKVGGTTETEKSGPEDVPVSADTRRESASESSYCQSMSNVEAREDGGKTEVETGKETENDGVEAGSQSSSDFDFSETIPKFSDGGKHSKQKTLFASSQRGRGRGKRGGRGRGRASSRASGPSRSSELRPEVSASAGTMETKGKQPKRGASAKSKAAAAPSTSGILSGDTGSVTAERSSVVVDKPATRQRRGRGSRSKTLTSAKLSGIAAADTSTLIKPVGSSHADSEGKNEVMKAAPGAVHVGDVESKASKTSSTSSTSDGASSVASSKCDSKDTNSKPAAATSIDAGMLSDESPDISLHSDHSSVASSASTPVMKDPLASSSGSSVASSTSSRGGRGGRRRGGGRGRASPRKGKAAKPALKSEASSTLRHKLTPEKLSDPHRVMFTGVVDKDGERTVRQLGGELVDSVYLCTHLVTDKVRRTVKFLCCLSRGCHIVSTEWLDQCRALKKFLPAEPFTIKDRAAERQHSFSLSRSCDSAKLTQVLAGYKVFLTPNVKPVKKDMADIIKCSGGEVLSSLPHTPEEGVIIVTCENDLSMCSEAMRAGVPVHSTELILGGVLKQELDFHSHVMSDKSSGSGSSGTTGSSNTTPSRKRKGKEPTSSQPSAKRRRK